jgi:hypothetical protein
VDGLKASKRINNGSRGKPIGVLAREAIRWAQDALRSGHSGVIGQRRNETTDDAAIGDDAILAYCLYVPVSQPHLTVRHLKRNYSAPVTLLTNDYNFAMKAQANDILALSDISASGEPLSSDLLIRQVLHGPIPLENTFIRPKEGDDIRMLDLSGTAEDHIKFLPGLGASRYAPKSPCAKSRSQITIDPKTGAVVLVKPGERPPLREADKKYSDLEDLIKESSDIEEFNTHFENDTYADIMALEANKYLNEDEMEWE